MLLQLRHPGYPILIKTVENRMARLLKLAGLNETLTPHSLRHTHIIAGRSRSCVRRYYGKAWAHGRQYNTDHLSSCDKRNKEKGLS
jgi:integrase